MPVTRRRESPTRARRQPPMPISFATTRHFSSGCAARLPAKTWYPRSAAAGPDDTASGTRDQRPAERTCCPKTILLANRLQGRAIHGPMQPIRNRLPDSFLRRSIPCGRPADAIAVIVTQTGRSGEIRYGPDAQARARHFGIPRRRIGLPGTSLSSPLPHRDTGAGNADVRC